MVIFGDDLLSDDEDDELKEGQKPIEVELNTHFDTSRGKSKLIKKESNISFYEKPEKHELETSEKISCVHPALAIEEDEPAATNDGVTKSKFFQRYCINFFFRQNNHHILISSLLTYLLSLHKHIVHHSYILGIYICICFH